MNRRRVVVTGVGAVSPGGVGADALWALVTRSTDEPVRRDVPDFDGTTWIPRRDLRRTALVAQYAVAAAAEAWAAAGAPAVDPWRLGVVLGTAFGASDLLHEAALTFTDEGAAAVPPASGLAACSSVAASTVARHLGARGHVQVSSGACASGVLGLVDGARMVAHGEADVVLAGGAEGPISPSVDAAYANLRAMSRSGWERPFDVRRDGFVYSAGAGVLVLEDHDAATARGATILGEVAGWSTTNDADDMVRPSGTGSRECLERAVAHAGLAPTDIVHVSAHGTGTALNDTTESAVVNEGLPGAQPIVTSIKGRTGHGAGASGAWEAIAVLQAFAHGVVPPVAADLQVDPDVDLDLVSGEPRPWTPGPAVDCSYGIGGQNGCVVLLPPAWR